MWNNGITHWLWPPSSIRIIQMAVGTAGGDIWLELCTSYSPSYHHHLYHPCSNKIQNGGILVVAYAGCHGQWNVVAVADIFPNAEATVSDHQRQTVCNSTITSCTSSALSVDFTFTVTLWPFARNTSRSTSDGSSGWLFYASQHTTNEMYQTWK